MEVHPCWLVTVSDAVKFPEGKVTEGFVAVEVAGFPLGNVHAQETIGSPAAGVEPSVNCVRFPAQTVVLEKAATGKPVTLKGRAIVSLQPVWLVTISVTV